MKFTTKLLLTLAVITISINMIKSTKLKDIDAFYNQKQVFPNQYEASTNTTQLESANYTSPFMSHVLFEEDPKRKLRKNRSFHIRFLFPWHHPFKRCSKNYHGTKV